MAFCKKLINNFICEKKIEIKLKKKIRNEKINKLKLCKKIM